MGPGAVAGVKRAPTWWVWWRDDVSLVVRYLVYVRTAGYLLAVAGIFAVVGVALGWDDNLAQLLLVSAVLFAVGALIARPELVTERVQNGFDGRFTGR